MSNSSRRMRAIRECMLVVSLLTFGTLGQAIARPTVSTGKTTPPKKVTAKAPIHQMAKLFSSKTLLSVVVPNIHKGMVHVKKGASNAGNIGKYWQQGFQHAAKKLKREFKLGAAPKDELQFMRAIGIVPSGSFAFSMYFKPSSTEPDMLVGLEYSNAQNAVKILRDVFGRDFARISWNACSNAMSIKAQELKNKKVKGPYTFALINKTYPKLNLVKRCPHHVKCEYFNYRYSKRSTYSYLRGRCHTGNKKTKQLYSQFYDVWKAQKKKKLKGKKVKGGVIYGDGPQSLFSYATVGGKYLLFSTSSKVLRGAISSYSKGGSNVSQNYRIKKGSLAYAHINNEGLVKVLAENLKNAMNQPRKWARKYRTREARTLQLLNNTFKSIAGRLWNTSTHYKAKVVASHVAQGLLKSFFYQKPGTPASQLFRYVPSNAIFALAQNMSKPLGNAIFRFIQIQAGPKTPYFVSRIPLIVGKNAAMYLLPTPRRQLAFGGVVEIVRKQDAHEFLNKFAKLTRFKFDKLTYKKQKIRFYLSSNRYRRNEFAYTFIGNRMIFAISERMKPHELIYKLVDLAQAKGKGSLASKLKSTGAKHNAYFHMSFTSLVNMIRMQMGRRVKYRRNQDFLSFLGIFGDLDVKWVNKKGKIHLNAKLKMTYKP